MKLTSLALQTPGALPPILWGAPGIGKSQRVAALAAALGWDLEILSPGERGEGAFGVVPVPDLQAGVLRYPQPEWAARFYFGSIASEEPCRILAACRGAVLMAFDGEKRPVLACAIGTCALPPRFGRAPCDARAAYQHAIRKNLFKSDVAALLAMVEDTLPNNSGAST